MAEFSNAFGSCGITCDYYDFGAPFFECVYVGFGYFVKFGVGFFAVRAIFGVGNIKILFAWKKFFNGIKYSGATDAGIEYADFHALYYTIDEGL